MSPSNALVQLRAFYSEPTNPTTLPRRSAAAFVRPPARIGNYGSPSSVHEAEHAHSGVLSRPHRIAQLAEQDVRASCYER